jgi:eukaryotic-like serine/threonine-protein kinase
VDTRPRIRRGRNPRPTGQPQTQADEEALVGTIVDGRYALEEIVGRGGMGVVYRGEHVTIRRPVAVKVLLSALAGIPELRSRFEREAMAIGKIDNPNCVGVFDVGSMPDGSLYLVMEFLEGEPLGDLLQRENLLEPPRAMHILSHVLRGLEHIHSVGIVHRDIKLDNIHLITQDGDPDFAKILDFGIAKTIGAEQQDEVKLTQAGIAFGTPLYMAPEQALGNPIDGRADLYAASVMAYEMLTGRPPFYSDDKIELLSMHTTREPPPMRERMPKGARPVPSAIEALVRRGLAKRPADRIPSATEYLAQIHEALATTARVDRTASEAPVGSTGAQPLVTMTGSSMIISEALTPPPPKPIDLLPGVPKTGAARISLTPLPIPKLRSIWLYVVGLLVAGAIGVAIAVWTTRKPPTPVNVAEPEADTPAAAAAKELEKGNPAGAIAILEAVKDQIAEDPIAQLQLGHALAATRENKRALAAYTIALELKPELEVDQALRANLASITDDKDTDVLSGAFELMITKTRVTEAKERLLSAAVEQDMERRAAVRPLIEKLGFGDQVDWFLAYSLDLQQGTTCEKRKPAVAKLRATGDARAIKLLEQAMVRKGKKSKLLNQCLLEDAASALTYLRGLQPTPPGPEAPPAPPP